MSRCSARCCWSAARCASRRRRARGRGTAPSPRAAAARSRRSPCRNTLMPSRRLATSRPCRSQISAMPAVREAAAFLDLLVLDVGDDPLDDVADLLHVDREGDDVGPAPALLLLQRLARDLRQVELDRRVQLVDDVVHLAQPLGEDAVVGLEHRQHAGQHLLDDVADAQRLARGAARSRAPACRAPTDRDGAASPDRRHRASPAAAARRAARSAR